MQSKRFAVLLLVAALSACRQPETGKPPVQTGRPQVQSPQLINVNNPRLEPAVTTRVTKAGDWCFLNYNAVGWKLCNIHYHRPAEHGYPFGSSTMPPCPGANATSPQDWVEIHYAYCRSGTSRTCNQQSCPPLRACALTTELGGPGCPAPFVVRSIWARVTANGTFRPKVDPLPRSNYYAEYDGSSTGGSGGEFPAFWKVNRSCVEITAAALAGVHLDPSRGLQPDVPPLLRPRSTRGS